MLPVPPVVLQAIIPFVTTASDRPPVHSVVVPVYRNSENIPQLLAALETLRGDLDSLEAVLVVDGSPDDSYLQLATRLPDARFPAQLITLSRNFGSFAAIRAGLAAARGELFAVMTADLQEPLELIVELFRVLEGGQHDLAVGQRMGRQDPSLTRVLARTYWGLYRRFVQPQIPAGGVDIFACRRNVRDQILRLRESNNSLIGLLFWIGFRRATIPYVRRKRTLGRSAHTLGKRMRYLSDSVFNFSDLPIRLIFMAGVAGVAVSLALALEVVVAKVSGAIPVPGYATTVFVVIFFGGLNCLGLGIIGGYVWRSFENSQRRPNYIVASHELFGGGPATSGPGKI